MRREEAKERIKEAINQEDVNKELIVDFLEQAMIADLQAVHEITEITGSTLAGFDILGKALMDIETSQIQARENKR